MATRSGCGAATRGLRVSEQAVRARALAKRVGPSANRRTILAGVDIDAAEGEVLVIAGRSGSGKTTLMGILGGLIAQDEGEVAIFGRRLDLLGPAGRREFIRESIGWVFQASGLLPDLTAEENVALALNMNGLYGDEAKRRSTQALGWVDLINRAGHRARELSGGEQQRVALARAIVKEPLLLLADEPTSQLDTETARSMMRFIRDVADSGTTVLVATHDEAARDYADKLIHLEDGRILD
jgi:putative ABC transport system ATP-binding protein